jgi:hypothetical protein
MAKTLTLRIYKQSCKTNHSGYSIRNNTNRSTFVPEDSAASGTVLDVHRKMEEICLSYHTREYYMMHFRITNTSGY